MKTALPALVALASMATPAVAAPACLTGAEAESIALVALPEILRETGRICAGSLPPTSLIRRPSGAFLAKYQIAADRAWPAARAAIVKLSDPAVALLLESDYARPLLTAIAVPQVLGQISVSDCPTIDRLTTLLEPLPARNTAGIVVTTLQFLKAEKAKGRPVTVPDLPVCTEPAR